MPQKLRCRVMLKRYDKIFSDKRLKDDVGILSFDTDEI